LSYYFCQTISGAGYAPRQLSPSQKAINQKQPMLARSFPQITFVTSLKPNAPSYIVFL
jgi:hypothetical protein